jgi:hypothetical protein
MVDQTKRPKTNRKHELAPMKSDRVALGIKEERKLIQSALARYDATVLAYGQLELAKVIGGAQYCVGIAFSLRRPSKEKTRPEGAVRPD